MLTRPLLAILVAIACAGCAQDDIADEPAAPECFEGGFVVECEDGFAQDNNDDTPEPAPDPDDLVVAWESFDERPCPEDSILTYENFGRPFMLNWCTGCHSANLPEGERAGAPMGTDLDTIEGVQALSERIWTRSADDNLTMPPVGGSNPTERFLLGEWLACGAP